MENYSLEQISEIENDEYFFQECQNKQVNENFKCFHKYLVDTIIAFCKVNKLTDIDEVTFRVDHLKDSISKGEWKPWTDSSLELFKENSKTPYLYNV